MNLRAFSKRVFALHGYVPAVVALAIAVAFHLVWVQFMPPRSYVVSFVYLVAILAASWCGYGCGLLVSVLSVAVVPYLLIPDFTIRSVQPGAAVALVLLSLIVARTAQGRRDAEQRLLQMNEELDKRVQQRTAELNQANGLLRDRIAEVETLYSELFVGLAFLDTRLHFVRVNQQLAAMYGAPVNAHLGRQLREVLPRDLADVVQPQLQRVIDTRKPMLDFEFTYSPDPSLPSRDWLMGCAPVESEAILQGVQVVIQDITERKRSERTLHEVNAELQANEERFRTLVNAIPQLAWMADRDGFIFWYNARWFEYTGTTIAQMEGWGWQSVHDESTLPAVLERWKASLATGAPFDMEFPLRGKDGRFRWFLTRIIPMRNSSGEIVRWFGTNTDIHDLREAREALRESEARFRSLADSAPVMIWLSGPDQRFTWYNKPWLAYAGASIEDELAARWDARIHPEDIAACRAVFSERFLARESFVIEYRRRRYDGEWRWVLDNGIPRLDGQGSFLGYIGSCIEIHDRKEMEQNLRRANTDLEQFAYSASHDLQEPLRTVSIYSELIGLRYGEQLEGQGREFLSNVTSAASRMEMLVRDLHAYTQAASTDARPWHLEDVAEAVEAARANLAAVIAESSAQLTFGALPFVRVKKIHLQQLFESLISNAIKYRGDSPPLVRIDAVQQQNHWLFSVTDNGIGIDPAYKERIFGIFKRLHTADKYPGTGIGLAICRRIVEHYGGRIWVESGSGSGSTFYFTLPG